MVERSTGSILGAVGLAAVCGGVLYWWGGESSERTAPREDRAVSGEAQVARAVEGVAAPLGARRAVGGGSEVLEVVPQAAPRSLAEVLRAAGIDAYRLEQSMSGSVDSWRRADLGPLRDAVLSAGVTCGDVLACLRSEESTHHERVTAVLAALWAKDWSPAVESELLDEAMRDTSLLDSVVLAVDRRGTSANSAVRQERIAQLVEFTLRATGNYGPGVGLPSREVGAALDMLRDAGANSGLSAAQHLLAGNSYMHITEDAWGVLASSKDEQFVGTVVDATSSRRSGALFGLPATEGDARVDQLLTWAFDETKDAYVHHVRNASRAALLYSGSERGHAALAEWLNSMPPRSASGQLTEIAKEAGPDDLLDVLRMARAVSSEEAVDAFLAACAPRFQTLAWDPRLEKSLADAAEFLNSTDGWDEARRDRVWQLLGLE